MLLLLLAGERDNELLNALNILLAIAWHCMHNIRYMVMSDANPTRQGESLGAWGNVLTGRVCRAVSSAKVSWPEAVSTRLLAVVFLAKINKYCKAKVFCY